MIHVQVGAAPWLPAADAEAVAEYEYAEYEYYEMPLSGVVRQAGVEYFFTCMAGQEENFNFWVYWPITAADREAVESAKSPKDFRSRLLHALGGHAVVAVASDDYGILGWRDFDGGDTQSMAEAGSDLIRWMDRVAEIAPRAHERSGELVGA
jgi:hypothetical protein